MRTDSLKNFLRVILVVAAALVCARAAGGQEKCVSDTEVKAMVARLNSAQGAALNAKLRETLLKLREESQKNFLNSLPKVGKEDALMNRIKESREKNAVRLCPILKEYGWPGANACRW